MATTTTSNLDVTTEHAAQVERDNAAARTKALAAVDLAAHEAIAERNAKHEAFLAARKEQADNGERDTVTFEDAIDNAGNRDTRVKTAARNGNIVDDGPVIAVEAHRADREWLQHEDFSGGYADVQAMKDARDRAERAADRDAIAAEREARETGSKAPPSTTTGAMVREPGAPVVAVKPAASKF